MSIATSDAKEQSDKGAFGGGKVDRGSVRRGSCKGIMWPATLSYGRPLFTDFV
jgi:hypothetical protein